MKRRIQWLEKGLAWHPWLARLYMAPYQTLLKQEAALADLRSHDRACLLGCGALPFTLIHWLQHGVQTITAVDYDATALTIAQNLIQRLGWQTTQVNWQMADAEAVDLADFDLTLVTLQIFDKTRIYHNWLTQAPAGSRLLVRQPKPKYAATYGRLVDDDSSVGCPQTGGKTSQASTHYRMRTFASTQLFSKPSAKHHEV